MPLPAPSAAASLPSHSSQPPTHAHAPLDAANKENSCAQRSDSGRTPHAAAVAAQTGLLKTPLSSAAAGSSSRASSHGRSSRAMRDISGSSRRQVLQTMAVGNSTTLQQQQQQQQYLQHQKQQQQYSSRSEQNRPDSAYLSPATLAAAAIAKAEAQHPSPFALPSPSPTHASSTVPPPPVAWRINPRDLVRTAAPTDEDPEGTSLSAPSTLGTGAYGSVHRALWHGQPVAVKVLDGLPTDGPTYDAWKAELDVWSQLRFPGLVSLYGACSHPHLSLVMELCPNGALSDHVHGRPDFVLPWITLLRLMGQVAAAMVYMHGRGVLHRDLKSFNVLLDEEGNAKLGDFGLSVFMTDNDKLYTQDGAEQQRVPATAASSKRSTASSVTLAFTPRKATPPQNGSPRKSLRVPGAGAGAGGATDALLLTPHVRPLPVPLPAHSPAPHRITSMHTSNAPSPASLATPYPHSPLLVGLPGSTLGPLGTYGFMAPEVFQRGAYSPASDVYAYGLTLWEIVARAVPFGATDPTEIGRRVVAGERPPMPGDLPEAYAELIRDCWAQRAEDRPTAAQVQQRVQAMEAEAREEEEERLRSIEEQEREHEQAAAEQAMQEQEEYQKTQQQQERGSRRARPQSLQPQQMSASPSLSRSPSSSPFHRRTSKRISAARARARSPSVAPVVAAVASPSLLPSRLPSPHSAAVNLCSSFDDPSVLGSPVVADHDHDGQGSSPRKQHQQQQHKQELVQLRAQDVASLTHSERAYYNAQLRHMHQVALGHAPLFSPDAFKASSPPPKSSAAAAHNNQKRHTYPPVNESRLRLGKHASTNNKCPQQQHCSSTSALLSAHTQQRPDSAQRLAQRCRARSLRNRTLLDKIVKLMEEAEAETEVLETGVGTEKDAQDPAFGVVTAGPCTVQVQVQGQKHETVHEETKGQEHGERGVRQSQTPVSNATALPLALPVAWADKESRRSAPSISTAASQPFAPPSEALLRTMALARTPPSQGDNLLLRHYQLQPQQQSQTPSTPPPTGEVPSQTHHHHQPPPSHPKAYPCTPSVVLFHSPPPRAQPCADKPHMPDPSAHAPARASCTSTTECTPPSATAAGSRLGHRSIGDAHSADPVESHYTPSAPGTSHVGASSVHTVSPSALGMHRQRTPSFQSESETPGSGPAPLPGPADDVSTPLYGHRALTNGVIPMCPSSAAILHRFTPSFHGNTPCLMSPPGYMPSASVGSNASPSCASNSTSEDFRTPQQRERDEQERKGQSGRIFGSPFRGRGRVAPAAASAAPDGVGLSPVMPAPALEQLAEENHGCCTIM